MATLVRFTIDDPQDVLDTFGAGALSRVERDTTSAMTGASEVTTVAVVATTTEHEYRDQTGVAGTHWYRIRYSTAAPAVAADYSGYGPVFQAGSPAGAVLALETVKTWQSIDDTVDDPWLPIGVGAMNEAVIDGIGVDIGPSPDTVRTFRLDRKTNQAMTRLWVDGGLRTFTTIDVSYDGTTWTDVTADLELEPAYSRPPWRPASYIELKAYTTVISSLAGYRFLRITGPAFGTFGWDAYPHRLVQMAAESFQRMCKDRAGLGNFPTATDARRYLNEAVLADYRRLYFAGVA